MGVKDGRKKEKNEREGEMERKERKENGKGIGRR